MRTDRGTFGNIIISRTDSIGDVVLTLPMAASIKAQYPDSQVSFLGRKYTQPIVDQCQSIDRFIDWDSILELGPEEQREALAREEADVIIHVFPVKEIAELAKKVSIPLRVGTSHRLYHLTTCNKLINLGRKNSDLHEAQLNIKLLKPLGIDSDIEKETLSGLYNFKEPGFVTSSIRELIDPSRFNLILHPKSKGSAREWGTDNYSRLIEMLSVDDFKIFITGTAEDGELLSELLDKHNYITNLTGKLSLEELISFINLADGLIAASTGPLHIASALGKHAMGIYSPMRPIHPGRWAPIGENAKVFVAEDACEDCRNLDSCACMIGISPSVVKEYLLGIVSSK